MLYRTVVVDPPWQFQNQSGEQKPQYALMSMDDIKRLDLRSLTEANAHLYCWVVDAFLFDCGTIIRGWGFEPKLSLVWIKHQMRMGNYHRHQHEICVFAVKGKLPLLRHNASTLLYAPSRAHSEKPHEFYSFIETCSPGPYLDVFARALRAGWDVIGDQVNPDAPYQIGFTGVVDSHLVSRTVPLQQELS